MSKLLNFLIVNVLAGPLSTAINVENLGEIIMTQVVIQHGEMTPEHTYMTDPYKLRSLWPTDFGQLTPTGVQEGYQLGLSLREHYAKLLPISYSVADIEARSTDVDPCLMTATSCLAGLYANDSSSVWNPDIPFLPLPVHTNPLQDDEIIGNKTCQQHDILLSKLYTSELMEYEKGRSKRVFDVANVYTGKSDNDWTSLKHLYDVLRAEAEFGFEMPFWTVSILPTPLDNAVTFAYTIDVLTPELRRLKIGPLLKEIAERMEKKVTGQLHPDRKMFMYSVQGSTMAHLLHALGVYDGTESAYTRAAFIELREKDRNYYVTLQKIHSTTKTFVVPTLSKGTQLKHAAGAPYLIEIPGCPYPCLLLKFVDVLEPLLPEDWEKECNQDMIVHSNAWKMLDIISICLFVAVFIIIAVIVIKKWPHLCLCRRFKDIGKVCTVQSVYE